MEKLMGKHSKSNLISFFASLSEICAILTFVIGCSVLLGWFFHISILKSGLPGIVTMKFNTALCFVLLGISLWLLQEKRSGKTTLFTARVCLVIISTILVVTTFEYMYGKNINIDELFFPEDPNPVFTVHPGRMALNALISFIFITSALFLLSGRRKDNRSCYLAQIFCSLSFVMSLFAIIDYIYGVKFLYFGLRGFTPMAMHTAIAMLFVSLGVFFVCLRVGLPRIFSSDTMGGLIARSLVPVAIVVPPTFGFLKIWAEKKGIIFNELGVALVAIFNMVVLNCCAIGLAFFIDYIETKRKKESEKFIDLNLRYRAILAAVPDIIMEVDINKIYTWANDAGYKFLAMMLLVRTRVIILKVNRRLMVLSARYLMAARMLFTWKAGRGVKTEKNAFWLGGAVL